MLEARGGESSAQSLGTQRLEGGERDREKASRVAQQVRRAAALTAACVTSQPNQATSRHWPRATRSPCLRARPQTVFSQRTNSSSASQEGSVEVDHGQPRGSRTRVLAGRNNEFLCQGNHFVSNHFMLQITFVICSQWVSLCWFVLCCVVFLSPSGRLSLLCAGVVSAALALEIVVRDGQRWLSYAEKRFVDRW